MSQNNIRPFTTRTVACNSEYSGKGSDFCHLVAHRHVSIANRKRATSRRADVPFYVKGEPIQKFAWVLSLWGLEKEREREREREREEEEEDWHFNNEGGVSSSVKLRSFESLPFGSHPLSFPLHVGSISVLIAGKPSVRVRFFNPCDSHKRCHMRLSCAPLFKLAHATSLFVKIVEKPMFQRPENCLHFFGRYSAQARLPRSFNSCSVGHRLRLNLSTVIDSLRLFAFCAIGTHARAFQIYLIEYFVDE